MAFPWLTVLQSVPWVDVIRSAPKVADGAKRLWNNVSGKPAGNVESRTACHVSEPIAPEILQARLRQAEMEIDALHAQMLASSELIKALAEQNAEMANGLEIYRRRFYWLSLFTLLLALAVAVSVLFSAGR